MAMNTTARSQTNRGATLTRTAEDGGGRPLTSDDETRSTAATITDQPQHGFSRRMALASLATALLVMAVAVAVARNGNGGARPAISVTTEQRPAMGDAAPVTDQEMWARTVARREVAPVSDQEMWARLAAGRRDDRPLTVYLVSSEEERQYLAEALAERDSVTMQAGQPPLRSMIEVAGTAEEEARIWHWVVSAAGFNQGVEAPMIHVIDFRKARLD